MNFISSLGNIYFNNILTGFAELLGNIITIPIIKYIGLKKTAISFNIIAGITMLITLTLFEKDYPTVGVYLSFIGKIFNIGAWCVQLTYIAELFPSDVRSAGIAMCMIVGQVGTMIAPPILRLQYEWLQLTVFGVLSLFSAFMHFFLPDLTGVPMFNTTAEQKCYFSKVKTRV